MKTRKIITRWIVVVAVVLTAALPGVVRADVAGSLGGGRNLSTAGGTIYASLGPNLAPAIGAGTGYTCGAGWDCSVAGTLDKNADGVGTAVPNPAITAVVGSTYEIVLTLGAVTVGNGATYTFGGTTGTTALTAATTYTHYVTAATTASLIITPTPTATRFTITAVSVKLLTDATGDLTVQGDLTVRSAISVSPGTSAAPSITGGDADSGFGFVGGNPVLPGIFINSFGVAYGTGATLAVASSLRLSEQSTFATSPAAATWQLGLANAAAPVAQTLTAQGCRGGTDSDCAGKQMTIGPTAASGGTGLSLPAGVTLNRGLVTTTGTGAQGAQQAFITCGTKTLSTTSATAQTVATITTTTTSAGGVQMFYSVTASDGTNVDVDSANVSVSWNNLAATVAATMSAAFGGSNSVVAPDTLTSVPTATVATNVVSIKLTPTWVNTVPTLVRSYITFLVNASDAVVCQ